MKYMIKYWTELDGGQWFQPDGYHYPTVQEAALQVAIMEKKFPAPEWAIVPVTTPEKQRGLLEVG